MTSNENVPKQGFLQKNRKVITIVLIIGLVISAISVLKPKNADTNEEEKTIIKQVKTEIVDKEKSNQSTIKTVGNVLAETQVDIVSVSGGTLQGLFFEVGNDVFINQTLAILNNNSTQTTLNNSRTALLNSESNLFSAERLSNESIQQTKISIEQAQVGLDNANKSIEIAGLGLATANDNLSNASSLREKGNLDAKNNAIITWNGYLNTIFSALDQVDALLDVDSSSPNHPSLGAKDQSTLTDAKRSYNLTNTKYNELASLIPTVTSIGTDMDRIVGALSLTEQMIDNTLKLLDNTVSGGTYPATLIASQKSSFVSQRSMIVSSENSAENISQSIKNIPLLDEQQDDGLRNDVKAAEAQLDIAYSAKDSAELSLKNAEQALSSSEQSKTQQLLNAKSQVDNSRGQVNLSLEQASNLNIKAPISGTITEKYVELGAEINPGQKIAQISKAENLKIIINLNSEDIYKIKVGDKAMINDEYEGTITNINPAADPVTKKVKVEVLFDNTEKVLIQGTFVDISISVEVAKPSTADAVFIPLRTLTITQNEKFIFVNEDNKAKKVLVETGIAEGAMIEIVKGLKNNDELIIDGAKNLEDGDEILVTN